MALWHGDVCHGPALRVDGRVRPLRIHVLMDDASRYITALEAYQVEMLFEQSHELCVVAPYGKLNLGYSW